MKFTDKTASVIYSYPISRIKIFVGKLLTLYIIIILIYVIKFAASYLTLYIAWGKLPSTDFIITDIKVNLYSALLQFLLMPIPIFIGNLSKNIIFPIIYGVLGAILSMFSMQTGVYMQLFPLILPSLPIYYFHIGDPIDYVLTIGNTILTFGISMSLCIYHYNNIDID